MALVRITPKRFTSLCILALFLYLTLYTWNLRTGYFDALAANTGLEFIALTLKPGKWATDKVVGFWERYIYLVGVREENDKLRAEYDALTLALERSREDQAELARLRALMGFDPPAAWETGGARVIAHRMGPNAALGTLVVDKGFFSGAVQNAPVVTPHGVVGRVLKKSAHASNVLLLTDPNSSIAVRGRRSRTTGIVAGGGPDTLLDVRYVQLNEPLAEGEILVTSGLAEIFPAGLPVARVVSIERSDISLFQTVRAEPLVNLRDLEEVLLLRRLEPTPAPSAESAPVGDEPQ